MWRIESIFFNSLLDTFCLVISDESLVISGRMEFVDSARCLMAAPPRYTKAESVTNRAFARLNRRCPPSL